MIGAAEIEGITIGALRGSGIGVETGTGTEVEIGTVRETCVIAQETGLENVSWKGNAIEIMTGSEIVNSSVTVIGKGHESVSVKESVRETGTGNETGNTIEIEREIGGETFLTLLYVPVIIVKITLHQSITVISMIKARISRGLIIHALEAIIRSLMQRSTTNSSHLMTRIASHAKALKTSKECSIRILRKKDHCL